MPTQPITAQINLGLSLWLDEKRGSRHLSHIPVEDPQITAETGLIHYPILIPTPDAAPPVPGRLYPVTPADLTAADAYEGEAYRRVRVTTEAGVGAWVYVAAEE
ncbi:gamma-glutamylcyclotransferase family protein [Brevundimonas sp. DS20]|uniref:gamma-glutamylcyclotransferase family protein n=1 Tax=Brevundimonas sp. DS20 TaxID=1532555 RepID=UPI0006CF49BA|nr:gamma-glutamylcyclotransferase family protein [Brevundimonas sp. DS20]ALJ07641.1 hypothetical protein JL11_04255 [Brevundimonas sp. DS20]